MSTKRPVFAGYVRVSKLGTRDPDDVRSPDIQRRAIEAMAEREGFDIEWLNPQLNVSGGKADRAVLMDAVARVEAGELAGIAVYKLDRLSRLSPRQRVELFERIEGERGEKPGRVKSATEDHDPATRTGRVMRDILQTFARSQWEEAQENFAMSVEDSIGNGCHAHAPFGYRKPLRPDGKVAKGRPLEVVADEAEVVHGLFTRRAGGMSWSELTRWAESTGVAPRKAEHWTMRSIERIIKNRAYTGEAFNGGHSHPGAHPPIVTLDEFEAANVARGVRPPRGEPALLSGLVRCAACRHRMHAATVGTRKQRVYRCKRNHGSGRCPAPASIAREHIDQHIADVFLARYGDVEVSPADNSIAEAAAVLQAAQRELNLYTETITVEDVGGEAFKAGARVRREKVEEAERAVHAARSAANGLSIGAEGVAIWPELSIDERRRLLRAGVDDVFVKGTSMSGRNVFDPARVRVFWRGEAPDNLPGPGVRVDLAPLDW